MYHYAWYLSCPQCKTMYLVDEAKQPIGDKESGEGLF